METKKYYLRILTGAGTFYETHLVADRMNSNDGFYQFYDYERNNNVTKYLAFYPTTSTVIERIEDVTASQSVKTSNDNSHEMVIHNVSELSGLRT